MLDLKVNGVSKASIVDWKTLIKTEVLTKEVDTLDFEIKGSKFVPKLGDDITLFDGALKIFGGVVIEREEKVLGGILLGYAIRCKDYTHLLDKKLVIASYVNKTANYIIKDPTYGIIPQYAPGFTTVNVDAPKIVPSISFNYEQISRALTLLADQIYYDWYVDYNKDIHFFDEEKYTAPFNIDDTSGNHIWGSLEVNSNLLEVKNSIFVRGGEYKGATDVWKYTADGQQRIFYVPYKLTEIEVRRAGVVQTIGTDNITNPLLVDILYNFDEKLIKFREDNKPSAGTLIEIQGRPFIPVIISLSDDASISTYGEYQHIIIDKSIISREEAREVARGELKKFASSVYEASFRTLNPGLKAGQKIHIKSNLRGIDRWFKINKIITQIRTPNELEYEVFLIASGTTTFTDIMIDLLEQNKKTIKVAKDEVLDKIKTAYETTRIIEELQTATAKNIPESISISESYDNYKHTPPFKWAPYDPKSARLRWSLSSWS